MTEESVKVAVRVRPFGFLNEYVVKKNGRERDRNSQLVIEMNGKATTIVNPEDNEDKRTFTFDHSYWSHDGADKQEDGYFGPKPDSGYIGQQEVFDDLGVGILNNAWEGYNTTLFAYGQTGSGKSWSVVGYGANKGVVPRLCEEIFKKIAALKNEGSATEYEIVFSMLEIYNEKVHDLLNSKNVKRSLKIRQHPKKGFYADGLTITPVKDFSDIERKMDEGTKNRTIASTNMNATSSRAHTIVGITFIQKSKNAAGEETSKSSLVNLVDLAGSERADSTGATGDRLKEGAAINQSLSSLGNCIAALAEKSEGKSVRVPFRDSVLTKLLKNALGGNSKTIMIAALSPADINYEETLSTLRYADRAKQIKTKAVVNEDPTEKLIRDLQEENERLKDLLASGQKPSKLPKADDDDDDDEDDEDEGLSEEEVKARVEEELAARMAENERMMNDMQQKWEEKLAAAEQQNKENDEKERLLVSEKKSKAHLYNLNPDPMLTGTLVYLLNEVVTVIGKKDANEPPTIPLIGLNIRPKHGEISKRSDGKFALKAGVDCRLLVNGEPLTGEMELAHNDRLMFGTSHLYVFGNPHHEIDDNFEVTYEMAQKEIALNSGMNVKRGAAPVTKEEKEEELLKEELTDFLPEINVANGISEELNKKVQFEVAVLTPAARGKSSGRKEIFVRVLQLETGYMWFWSKSKFTNRKYVMHEMFEDFQNGDKWQVPAERDPFIESSNAECLVGTVEVYLLSLPYQLEYIDEVPVVDYRGVNIGHLKMKILPCKEDGSPIGDIYIEDPSQLKGKRMDFKVVLERLCGLPKRYTDIFCQYDLLTHEQLKTSVVQSSIDVVLNYEKIITIDGFSERIADSLANKPMIVQVWGKQKPDRVKPVNNAAKLGKTTREIMKAEALRKSLGGKVSKKPMVDLTTLRNNAETLLMRRRMEAMSEKLDNLRKYCKEKEKKGESQVQIWNVFEIIGRRRVKLKFKKLKRQNSTSSLSSTSSASSSDSGSDDDGKKGGQKRKSITNNTGLGEAAKKNTPKKESGDGKGHTSTDGDRNDEANKKKSSTCTLL